jgi:ribosome biogenesis protein ENP2
MVKAYMHGFFIDAQLYARSKAVAEPFAYDEYRRQKVARTPASVVRAPCRRTEGSVERSQERRASCLQATPRAECASRRPLKATLASPGPYSPHGCPASVPRQSD